MPETREEGSISDLFFQNSVHASCELRRRRIQTGREYRNQTLGKLEFFDRFILMSPYKCKVLHRYTGAFNSFVGISYFVLFYHSFLSFLYTPYIFHKYRYTRIKCSILFKKFLYSALLRLFSFFPFCAFLSTFPVYRYTIQAVSTMTENSVCVGVFFLLFSV